MLKTIGIFGGTFDPVHLGHITIAQDIQQHLQLDEMRLVPCRLPPHRDRPTASDDDRLQMLQLAIKNTSLQIDERELKRKGPSYTFDTLQSLHNENIQSNKGNNCSLILCMGMDAFAGFNNWHRWQDIPGLAHIVVVTRAHHDPESTSVKLNAELTKLLEKSQVKDKTDLKKSLAGKIYLTQLSQIPVSSTSIRRALARYDQSEGDHRIPELNPEVQQFIQKRGLYHP